MLIWTSQSAPSSPCQIKRLFLVLLTKLLISQSMLRSFQILEVLENLSVEIVLLNATNATFKNFLFHCLDLLAVRGNILDVLLSEHK